jgi:hypothetical protein
VAGVRAAPLHLRRMVFVPDDELDRTPKIFVREPEG